MAGIDQVIEMHDRWPEVKSITALIDYKIFRQIKKI